MSSQERILQQRLVALQQRSAWLRDDLLLQAHTVAPALAFADSSLKAWHWLRLHPHWPLAAAAVAGLVVVRPRQLPAWIGRGLWVWQLWRRFGPVWRALVRRP